MSRHIMPSVAVLFLWSSVILWAQGPTSDRDAQETKRGATAPLLSRGLLGATTIRTHGINPMPWLPTLYASAQTGSTHTSTEADEHINRCAGQDDLPDCYTAWYYWENRTPDNQQFQNAVVFSSERVSIGPSNARATLVAVTGGKEPQVLLVVSGGGFYCSSSGDTGNCTASAAFDGASKWEKYHLVTEPGKPGHALVRESKRFFKELQGTNRVTIKTVFVNGMSLDHGDYGIRDIVFRPGNLDLDRVAPKSK